jgi:hypothetical protein
VIYELGGCGVAGVRRGSIFLSEFSFAPMGLIPFEFIFAHDLRRGLHSVADAALLRAGFRG